MQEEEKAEAFVGYQGGEDDEEEKKDGVGSLPQAAKPVVGEIR